LMSVAQSDSLEAVKALKQVRLADKVALVLSIWFGAGLLPGMPGTFGTLGAVPLYFVIMALSTGYKIMSIVIIVGGAIWSSWRAQCILGRGDAREIVVDEVAGFLLTTIFFPFTWLALGVGFCLFRFFDVLKPPPIKKIERITTGGLGIVLDDLIASAYASVCVWLVLYVVS
jgi:phosphatidylglycerophosphatase A